MSAQPNPGRDMHGSDAHDGPVIAAKDDFHVVDCHGCGYAHVVPMPDEAALSQLYRHDFYDRDKPLYLERYAEDRDWWQAVYAERYQVFEGHLPADRRRVLDVGSGPGLFLDTGVARGWTVHGIEPGEQAVAHCRARGLVVTGGLFDDASAADLDRFDAVHMALVLEHVPDPGAMLRRAVGVLAPGGVACIVVPNDFNALQTAALGATGGVPWWVAPPHHLNYFTPQSLERLARRAGLEVVARTATFPMELFVLMGDNYVGDDALGRACHGKRKRLEMAVREHAPAGTLANLNQAFADAGLGREIVLYARRPAADA